MAFEIRKQRRPAGKGRSFDLTLALACALITAALALMLPPGLVPDIIPGASMVLFVPGYGLAAVLFPGRRDIGQAERAALSAGMSAMAAGLAGLALYVSAPGFTSDILLACLAAITVACIIPAYRRRQRLEAESRFGIDAGEVYRGVATFFSGAGRLNIALVLVLSLAIIASVTAIAYAVMVPVDGEPFTEFYLLGPDGKAGDYVLKFHPGDPATFTVGITSHEYRDVTYDLVVTLNDSVNESRLYQESVTLAGGQDWEKAIELRPDLTGTHEKLEFLLYADGNYTAPYRELRLWVDVTRPLY